MSRLGILVLTATAAVAPLLSQPVQPTRKLADMESALARIAAWEYGQARAPLYEFSAFVEGAIRSKTELPRIEARLIQMLKPATSLAGRDFVCRQLSIVGTGASVPALAGMLTEANTADMARYALERIPGAASLDALRNALPKSSGKVRIGIVNSLGQRRDSKSVATLKGLATASEAGVSGAALIALARIANGDALAAIGAARSGASGPRKEEISQAYLRCAGAVAAGGDKAAARLVYRQLAAADEPPMIRIAALDGLAAVDGAAAIPALSRELASSNFDIQSAAIRFLNRIPGPEVTSLFVKQYPSLGPVGQIHVLTALGERGDAAGRPLAAGAVKSGTLEVRTAALAALAGIGDASTVPVLAQAAAGAEANEQSVARESLYSLRGAAIDSAIASAIGSSSGKVQLELIKAAGERPSPAAADVLMRVAQGSDRDASREAVRALRNAAGPAQVPALLDAVLKMQNAADRREGALALASVIKRAAHPPVGPVLAAYQSASDPQIRVVLLDVMGQVSAAEALPVLRSNLANSDAEISRAAVLALAAWQDPSPIPDLLALAKDASIPTRQILALRGLIKVIGAPSNRSSDETVSLLGRAMALAKEPAEKRAILAVLPIYPTKAGLQMAEAAMKDSSVVREATAAADNIRGLVSQ